jgi:hypothetical protein
MPCAARLAARREGGDWRNKSRWRDRYASLGEVPAPGARENSRSVERFARELR